MEGGGANIVFPAVRIKKPPRPPFVALLSSGIGTGFKIVSADCPCGIVADD